GRDLTARAELALDTDGTFLAFRGANTSNIGAHAVSFHPLNKGMALTATVYRMPAAAIRGRAVITNTSPTTPYRRAGRPEVMFIMPRRAGVAAIVGSASRTTSAQHRLLARAGAHHGTPRGASGPGAGHPLVRPGPRDQLRAAPGRVARRRALPGAADHRRYRRDGGRGRRALGARAAPGRDRDGEGVGPDRREGPADRRAPARGGRGRHRVRGAAVQCDET